MNVCEQLMTVGCISELHLVSGKALSPHVLLSISGQRLYYAVVQYHRFPVRLSSPRLLSYRHIVVAISLFQQRNSVVSA